MACAIDKNLLQNDLSSVSLYIKKKIFEVVLTTIAPLIFPLCMPESLFLAMLRPEIITYTFAIIVILQIWNLISFFTMYALRNKITAHQGFCNPTYNKEAFNLKQEKYSQV